MELATLFHKAKKGAIYQWRIWTEGADIVVEYGQIDGEKVVARKKAETKNVGRSNETTPEQQAELEAKSMWQGKQDRKYRKSIEEAKQRRIGCMLAPSKNWNETKKYASYPGDVQPKLDGCRCLAYWEGDRIVLLSRGQKEWDLPHIVEELEKVLAQDAMWDGELYVHGVPFQTIQSWVTKKRPESKQIEYHVYDVPICDGEEKIWDERRLDLERVVPGSPAKADPATPHIVMVPTLEVTSEDQVTAFERKCVELGYEGAMYRNRKGHYDMSGSKSNTYLLKVKTFDDAEFKCIGYTDGSGKNAHIVTWICSLDTDAAVIGYKPGYSPKEGDRTFNCDPLGSYDERAMWFQTADQFVGKVLTVKYFGLYESGTPRFPKGKAFRVEADLPKKSKK
jgi:ATP-dependent DNA ligase